MKLETFFEKFDLFADAPDAVTRMREVVLELAVRGQLSERLPADQADPAWRAFLKEFAGRIYGSDSGPPPPFNVPDEWRWVIMTDAADCRAAPKVNSASLDESAWVLDLEDIDGSAGKIIATATFAQRRSLSTKASFQKGDVLYGKLRPYLNKVVVADRPGFCTTEIVPLRPKPFVSPAYLRLFLRSHTFLGYAARKNYGMKMPRLGTKDLESAEVPLPPLAEQKRIVAKVDELMALCDRLEEQQQEREKRHSALARASLTRFAEAPTAGNLHYLFHGSVLISPVDLRKAILTLAFAGKLVQQDPKDEPASVLLEKARAEKARLIEAGLVKKEPWADKLQDATTLYDLPPGWEWTHVSDVVEKVTVGFVGSMKEQYRDTGVPFLRCQNVRENRYEPIGLTFISEEFHRDISKSTLRPGDVVVTRSGNVGVTCVIPDNLPEANCSDLVIVKRPLALVPAFLSYFINSIASGQIEAKTVGIALTHFNTQSVAQMTVALPPLAEQRRIVAKVEQLMALVDALETQLAAYRTTAEKLLSALVAELTGTKSLGQAPKPAGTGRRGRPRKS